MALTWTSTLVLPSHPAQWARQGLLIDSDTGLHFRAQSSMGPWESGSPRRPASARWGASGPDRVFQVPLQRALAESEPGPGLLAPVPDSDTSLGQSGQLPALLAPWTKSDEGARSSQLAGGGGGGGAGWMAASLAPLSEPSCSAQPTHCTRGQPESCRRPARGMERRARLPGASSRHLPT